ncbi:MAG: hypothetical protein IPI58_00440 [Alphaproteobacteria bacterium]|nr:MAG: hypothetical protein IPI58_00440 [Alphaproteobacteria bacterium]
MMYGDHLKKIFKENSKTCMAGALWTLVAAQTGCGTLHPGQTEVYGVTIGGSFFPLASHSLTMAQCDTGAGWAPCTDHPAKIAYAFLTKKYGYDGSNSAALDKRVTKEMSQLPPGKREEAAAYRLKNLEEAQTGGKNDRDKKERRDLANLLALHAIQLKGSIPLTNAYVHASIMDEIREAAIIDGAKRGVIISSNDAVKPVAVATDRGWSLRVITKETDTSLTSGQPSVLPYDTSLESIVPGSPGPSYGAPSYGSPSYDYAPGLRPPPYRVPPYSDPRSQGRWSQPRY